MSEDYNYLTDIIENCGNNISYFCGKNNSIEYNYFEKIIDVNDFNKIDIVEIVNNNYTIEKSFASEYRYFIFYEKMISYYSMTNYNEEILLYYYYYYLCGHFNSIVEVFYRNDIVDKIKIKLSEMKKLEVNDCYYLFNAYLMNIRKYGEKLKMLMNIYELFDKILFGKHELLMIPKNLTERKQLSGNLSSLYFYYKTLFYHCEKYYSEYDQLRIKKIILKNHIDNKLEIKKNAIKYFEEITFIYEYYAYGTRILLDNDSLDIIKDFEFKLARKNETKREIVCDSVKQNPIKKKKEKKEKNQDLVDSEKQRINKIEKILYSDFFEKEKEIVKKENLSDVVNWIDEMENSQFFEKQDSKLNDEEIIINYLKEKKLTFIYVEFNDDVSLDKLYYRTYSGNYDMQELCRINGIKITKELYNCDSWIVNEFVLPKGVIAKKMLDFLLFYTLNRRNNEFNTLLGEYNVDKYIKKYSNNVKTKLIDFISDDDKT